jgi:uncharacterized protein YsxB (DUF464 family)
MIKVKISHASNDQVNFLEVRGHANQAPHGEDIVCAGVSALLTAGFNNLRNHKDYELKLDEGYALFKAEAELDAHDEAVIETIICGLNSIRESYPKFIEVKTDK